MPNNIYTETQKSQLDGYLELFDLDTTMLSSTYGAVLHFTPYTGITDPISWRGTVYMPIPVKVDGIASTVQGSQPRPTITVGNVGALFLNAIIAIGDIAGAKVTVWRTFQKFLDGSPTADPNMFLPIESYIVEEKTLQNNETIVWTLCSPLDRPNVMLPGRQVLRDSINGLPAFPGVSRARIVN